MSHAELIERYLKGSEIMSQAVRGVSPAVLDKVPAPGKWSIHQYLVHVFDVELLVGGRVRQIVAEPGGNLMPLDQEKWAASLHYDAQPVEDVLAALAAARKVTANLLRRIPAAAWDNVGIHSKRGPLTLLAIVELATNHCENHARKIVELREQFAGAAKA
ncbi:MAG: DinB family protein [Candidatus Korobacteraceae bacterium]